MPRNSQGNYQLPLPDVIPNTEIDSAWANTTMNDIAAALTASLPRDGTAPMVGPLTLTTTSPTAPRHATSKAYVDQFMAYSSGLAVGSIFMWPSVAVVPGSCLKCDGTIYNVADYPDLGALLGSTFGGDGTTTFGVPNPTQSNGLFIRARAGSRVMGEVQADTLKSHSHGVTDPQHTHGTTESPHNHIQDAHGHTASQGAHSHSYTSPASSVGTGSTPAYFNANTQAATTGTAQPAVTVVDATATNQSNTTGLTVNKASTGLTVNAEGGTETQPANMSLDFYIKAKKDAPGPTVVTSIDSSDPLMLSIDATYPTTPTLVLHANVANGTVKLDGSAKIPSTLLPTGNQNLLGIFDASTNNNPSQKYPTYDYLNGDTFIVGVASTLPIDVYDPITGLLTPTVVTVGNELTWIEGSPVPTNPDGWYYIVATFSSVTATQVSFSPVGGIVATNVQAALAEVDSEKAVKPVGTSILKGNGSGGFANATSGTDYAPATSGSAILKGDGAGGFAAAAAGTDYLAPAAIGVTVQGYDAATAKTNVAQSWTANQNFNQTAFLIRDNTDTSKKGRFSAAGIATATTRVFTMPDKDGTMAMLDDITGGGIHLLTPVTASGAAVDFSGIPASAKRVTVMYSGLSLNAAGAIYLQLGTSSGVETTGYVGVTGATTGTNTCSTQSATAGALIQFTTVPVTAVSDGRLVLELMNPVTNTWVMSGTFHRTDNVYVSYVSSVKSLTGVLDRIRIAAQAGAFDGGTLNVSWE
jgi:microcystin-dependent protein